SLVALADVLVSAGGSMNREAAALGTPVWTVFEGRMGAVDEQLVAQGRLRVLRDPGEVEVVRRPPFQAPFRGRDPAALLDLALGGRALLRLIAGLKADYVVSTYPGTSEIFGRLRLAGRLKIPVASAITDLAALRYWSHPGVDLHLVTHPESVAEVRSIAGPRT